MKPYTGFDFVIPSDSVAGVICEIARIVSKNMGHIGQTQTLGHGISALSVVKFQYGHTGMGNIKGCPENVHTFDYAAGADLSGLAD